MRTPHSDPPTYVSVPCEVTTQMHVVDSVPNIDVKVMKLILTTVGSSKHIYFMDKVGCSQAPPSPTSLNSILSLNSEVFPQIHSLTLKSPSPHKIEG